MPLRLPRNTLIALLGLAACESAAPGGGSGPPVLDTGSSDCEERTWYADVDLDGFGDPDAPRQSCAQPDGWVADDRDCNDDDDGTFPGAIEACDGVDRDCNGIVDDATFDAPRWHPDGDGDGYGDERTVARSCTRPPDHVRAERGTDCDDADPSIFPGAPDAACDGIDQDCSGELGPEAAQIGGRTWPEAQLAFQQVTADDTLYLCAGEHRVTASLDHDLRLIGVGGRQNVHLRPLDASSRILEIEADQLVLEGVHLRHGRGDGDGGALAARVRVLRLTDVAFSDNRTLLRGGALHAEIADVADFEVTLRDIEAVGNRAGRSGGALSLDLRHTGFVTIEDAIFSGNRSERDGGALWIEGRDTTQVLSARRLIGRDNAAARRGGHVALLGKRNAILRGVDVDLRGGQATSGGLLSLDAPVDGKIELSGCVLRDGVASEVGGLVHHSGRFTLDNTLARCELSGGRAPVGGLQWLQTGTSAHLTWDDVDLHHGRAELGSAVWLTGTAAPFSGDLDRVSIRDNRGGAAFHVDPDYRSGDGLELVLTDGALLRNAGGGLAGPRAFHFELSDLDVGRGDDGNAPFDVRTGSSDFAWEGVVTTSCTDGVCE